MQREENSKLKLVDCSSMLKLLEKKSQLALNQRFVISIQSIVGSSEELLPEEELEEEFKKFSDTLPVFVSTIL